MVPCKQFISHFYEGLAKPVAVLSRPASPNGQADGRFIKHARLNGRFINNGRFIKAGPTPDGRFIKANGRFIKAL